MPQDCITSKYAGMVVPHLYLCIYSTTTHVPAIQQESSEWMMMMFVHFCFRTFLAGGLSRGSSWRRNKNKKRTRRIVRTKRALHILRGVVLYGSSTDDPVEYVCTTYSTKQILLFRKTNLHIPPPCATAVKSRPLLFPPPVHHQALYSRDYTNTRPSEKGFGLLRVCFSIMRLVSFFFRQNWTSADLRSYARPKRRTHAASSFKCGTIHHSTYVCSECCDWFN